jgi:beta-lactam-binding protein with PASTA domain
MGDTTFIPDIAKNAVKDQLSDGTAIKPGTTIRMGTKIDLLIGSGVIGEEVPVPDLFGLSYSEAKVVLEVNGLNTGVVLLDDNITDTADGFVYWQNPMPYNDQQMVNQIRAGQLLDIRLSLLKPDKRPEANLQP